VKLAPGRADERAWGASRPDGQELVARRSRFDLHRTLRWLLLGLCLFFAWHGVHAGLRAQGSDFTVFFDAGRAVLEGRDPRRVERFLYLPVFAVATAPLALLPYPVALILWQIASLTSLAWILACCQRMCERELGRALPWLGWAPLLCVLRLVDSNLANGQANLLVLGLVVAAVDAWLRESESRAGVLLGCAAALKIVPGFLTVLFLPRRNLRALLAAGATALACSLALPAAALGWSANLDGLTSWYRAELVPYLRGGHALLASREYPPGQSLTATTYRLLTDTPATSAGVDGPRANLLALDPEQVKWIVRLASAGVLVALGASLVVSARRAPRGARLREAALAVAVALMLSPLVHKAHMVWLLLPYALLLSGAPAGLTSQWRRVRWGACALSVLAIGATTPALLGRSLATRALSLDAVFLGLVCVTVALLVDLWGTPATT